MCDQCLPRLSRRRLIGGLVLGSVTAAATTLLGPPTSYAAVPVTPGLDIQPRSNWAGETRPPTGPLLPEAPLFLLVHHTATANGTDPVETMRGAYTFHTGPEKGWPDVAYNFFVDQNGVVWEGRAGSLAGPVQGSATGGNQGFSQLVCLLGDFTSVMPTAEALASLNQTLAWLADRDGIDTSPGAAVNFNSRGSNRWPEGTPVTASTISGHRDMSQTSCPGDTFYPYLITQVAAEVDAIRLGSVPTTTVAATTTAPESSTTEQAPSTTTSETSTTTTEPAPSTESSTEPAPASTSQNELEIAAPPPTPSGQTVAPNTPSPDGGSGTSVSLAIVGIAAAAVASGALWYTARRSNDSHSGTVDDEHQDLAD